MAKVACKLFTDPGAPTKFFAADFDYVGERMLYTVELLGLALIFLLVAVVKNIMYHAHVKHFRLDQSSENSGAVFSRLSINGTPACLGIGLIFYKVFNFPLYMIPDTFASTAPTAKQGIALLAVNCIITKFIFVILKWYRKRTEALGFPGDVSKMSTKDFAMEEPLRLFVKCLPFVFSWCWSNFGYYCVFTVGYSCPIMGAKCGREYEKTFFIQFGYAVFFTMACVLALPDIKQGSALMKRLNVHSIEVFLVDDHDFVLESHVKDEVIVSFCAINIGWAWTNIAETECRGRFSYTCPSDDELNYGTLGLNAIMVFVYYVVSIMVYHGMMESHRLKNRCRKVISIEDGNGARLFSGMDKYDEDGDGVLDKSELEEYIAGEGLNVEPFLQAAAMVDQRDGIITGDVSIDELMQECDTLMDKIKAGDYVAGEFTMADAQVEGLRDAVAKGEIPPSEAVNIDMVATSAVAGSVSQLEEEAL